MSDHEHEDVRRLFDLVADVPASQREAVLTRECAGDEGLKQRIRTMIAAAEDDRFLADATVDVVHGSSSSADMNAAVPQERVGEQIGHYRLLQQIGEGGFGVVYLAEQEKPVRRKVAMKIIKLGMDTKQVIARFEAERQALAMMDHPHIAKVFDAGATDSGRPYFIMELVRGEPITEYCNKHNLSVEERLALFQQTCRAVQHAHQKGIIHRDIKPNNVLVTLHDGRPIPKVIDFGIAKATNQRLTEQTLFTEFKQFIGTPEYMSPEQAEMSGIDMDTRSDVYSLGVLLYELLTGTTPFAASDLRSAAYGEIQRIIREETPHKPSTRLSTLDALPSVAAQRRLEPKKLSVLIRGDLDWIVMKALEKDRTRRYETATGFAVDIQRYLDNEPVVASPPSATYKLRKFIRRNRAGVTAASLVAAVLVLGVVGTSMGMAWALDEKARADRAATNATLSAKAEELAKNEAQDAARAARIAEAETQQRAEELEQVAEFQSRQLGDIDAELMGVRLRDALREATPHETHAELMELLSPVNFTSLALGSLEENLIRRSIEAIDAQFADQPLVRARLLQTVASSATNLGLLEMATDPQERALAIRRVELGDDHVHTMRSINDMGHMLVEQGKLTEAEPYYREALEGRRRTLGDDHQETLLSINSMGHLFSSQGKHAEAEPYFREALEGRRRTLGDDHPDTHTSIGNMGTLLRSQGKLTEAEPYYHEVLEARRRTLGDDHPETLSAINNLGTLFNRQGRPGEAEQCFLAALEGRRRNLGDNHPHTLLSMRSMASLLVNQNRLAEAEPYCRDALERSRRVLGDAHPGTLAAINSMGSLLSRQNRLAEAEPYCREALEGRLRTLGDDHERTLNSIYALGILLKRQGKLAEAEPYYREVLDRRRRTLGDDHASTLSSINNLAFTLRMAGKLDEAESHFREAMEGRRRTLGDDHPRTLVAINNLGSLLRSRNRLAEAEPYYREVLEGRQHALGDDHPETLSAIQGVADLLISQGRLVEAEEYYRDAIERRRRTQGDDHASTLRALNNMVYVLQTQGKLVEAEPYYREALEGRRRTLGDDHASTLRSIDKMAVSLRMLGKLDEAESHVREALEGRRRTQGDDHPLTPTGLHDLAGLLIATDRHAEAAPIVAECVAARTRVLGPTHEETRAAVAQALELYDAWHAATPDAGHDVTATEWRDRLAEIDGANATPNDEDAGSDGQPSR